MVTSALAMKTGWRPKIKKPFFLPENTAQKIGVSELEDLVEQVKTGY